MGTNRLDIDYKIINKLDDISAKISECTRTCNWDRKKELEKMYFEIYDQLDFIHQDYIEQRKGGFKCIKK